MLRHVECNLCKADDHVLLYKGNISSNDLQEDIKSYYSSSRKFAKYNQVVRCKRCGLVYANPRDDDGQIITLYRDLENPFYLHSRESRIITFQRYLKIVETYVSHGRILDVGCATGLFLELAKEKGWNVYGIEPSKWAVSYAQDTLNIRLGILEEVEFPREYFDTIILWDVLEHLLDPLSALCKLREFLKKGGFVFLSMPTIDSVYAKIFKKRWRSLLREHLYYFSSDTIKKMLYKSGFEVVNIYPASTTFTMEEGLLRLRQQYDSRFVNRIVNLIIKWRIGKVRFTLKTGKKIIVARSNNESLS